MTYLPEDILLPIVVEALKNKQHTVIAVRGNSMLPFLRSDQDAVTLKLPEAPPKRGDIILFRRVSGKHVLHRVVRVVADGGVFLVTGDWQRALERVKPDQILGIVCGVTRKGKPLPDNALLGWFFRGPWLFLRPVREPLLRLALFIKHLFTGNK